MEIKNVNLKDYSSFKLGASGLMVIVINEDGLLRAINLAKEKSLNIHILGEGTNTVFSDNLQGILFIKIEMVGISISEVGDDIILTANAGEGWDKVVSYAVEREWWGIENLSLIPGTVGAAPVQNIGAYGVELCNVLESVRVYDTGQNIFTDLQNSDCKFTYRDSIFKQQPGRYIIVSICLKLNKKPNPILTYKPLDTLINRGDLKLSEIRDLVVSTRQAKLPDYHMYPNAGSFFKNSVIEKALGDSLRAVYPGIPLYETEGGGYKVPTAWLIEHVAMMKGVREGDVGTWPSQPLVLVNYGSATYTDLSIFSQKIIDIIYAETGITLEREVNVVETTLS